VPSSLALIMSSFHDAPQARAIGIWTAWTSAAFIAGPLVGGMFVDLLSWRWVFGINVAPIAVTLWLLARLGRIETRAPEARVDYAGAALAVAGIGLPVFALIEQETLGWANPIIWVTGLVGVIAFAAFLLRQHRAAHPMMPLSLFRIRNFGWGNLATCFIYAALSLGSLIVTVFLIQSGGFPATLAGLATLPVQLILIALSSLMGRLAGRFGPRLFMTAGPLIMAIGFLLLLTISPDVDYWTQVLPGVVLFGLGLATTVAPLTAAVLGSIDARQSGIGSAINNAVARVAGLLSVALLGLISGGALDTPGFHRALFVTAALFVIGGLVSFAGIRTRVPAAPATGAGEAGQPTG